MLHRKQLSKGLWSSTAEARGEQRTRGTRIDNRCSGALQFHDRLVDDVDRRFVALGEKALVHVFAHDADADAVEPRPDRRSSDMAARACGRC